MELDIQKLDCQIENFEICKSKDHFSNILILNYCNICGKGDINNKVFFKK